MIAFIKGIVDKVLDGSVIVDNNGLGWQVNIPRSYLSRLPRVGENVKLYTHMQMREDGVSLFGFLSMDEKQLFELLISVTGVGPKAALSILSVLAPDQLIIAILSDDTLSLSKAPGIGKKTAQRVSLELRDKIKSRETENVTDPQQHLGFNQEQRQDAIDALTALGYGRTDAVKAVMETALTDMKTEQIIRLALRKLSGR
ncbi:MAG: Holliday junction branch migration protein RuvA [Clostridiales bacterium]|jgi:Holliday junction DNA helicase RuvA|nr:Holliday junction branch migration protein RuvA [Clostridiales bacterium]